MTHVLISVLLPAMGVAISPMPITALIFMLMNGKSLRSGMAFAVGWVVSLAVVMAAVLFVAGARNLLSPQNDITVFTYVIMLAIGALMIFFAVRDLLGRTSKSQVTPGWMHSMGSLSVAKAFWAGCFFAGLSPKNGVLAIAGAVVISGISVNVPEATVFAALFLAVAFSTVLAPVLFFQFVPQRAKKLSRQVVWLVQRNATIMSGVLLLLGFVLIGYVVVDYLFVS
jgi:hypothetical protein